MPNSKKKPPAQQQTSSRCLIFLLGGLGRLFSRLLLFDRLRGCDGPLPGNVHQVLVRLDAVLRHHNRAVLLLLPLGGCPGEVITTDLMK